MRLKLSTTLILIMLAPLICPAQSETRHASPGAGQNSGIQDNGLKSVQNATSGAQIVVAGAAGTVSAVTSVAPAVDPDSSYASANFGSRLLRELPRLSSVESLARLAPGVAARRAYEQAKPMADSAKDREFRFWINGGRPRSNNHLLNGQNNNDIDGRPAISIDNVDAVDTLHILTTRGAGDLSPGGASAINVITRDGTNDFHGTVFDYYLDRRLGALSPLERRTGIERAPKFMNSTFGGTIGGPVRRERLFFFGAFQAEVESSRRFVTSTRSFLTPTERGLQQLSTQFPDSATVRDLIARGPLARAVGDPQVGRRFSLFPSNVPVEFGEITRIIDSSAEGYEAGGQVDFLATRRDRLQAAYWYDGYFSAGSTGRLAAGYGAGTDARSHFGRFRWSRMLSPRTTNELAFGFNRARLGLVEDTAEVAPTQALTPSVSVGFRSLAYGSSPLAQARQTSGVFEVSDLLSHIVGRHNIKLGGQVGRRRTSFDYLPGRGGLFSYSSFEDFVLDHPAAITVAAGDPRSRFAETAQHYYIDDAWRVRSNLTLSLGLSYENAGQPVNDLIERLRVRESDPAAALFDASLPLELRTMRKVERDINNFAPRVGLAYMPRFRLFGRNPFGNDKTVIRAGAAVAYDQTAYRPLADVAASAPNVLSAVITPDSGRTLPAFPNLPDARTLGESFGRDPRRFARAELSSAFRTPYSVSWHVAASREFVGAVTAEATYIGSRGNRLLRMIDENPVIESSAANLQGPLRVYESAGRSSYHSLQARGDVRVTDNLTGGVTYTFSKLIDDVVDSGAVMGGGVGSSLAFVAPSLQTLAQNPFDVSRGERALSSLDRKHWITGHFLWTFPLRRGQAGVLGRLLGGWQASAIVEIASGSPFTPLQQIGPSSRSAAIFASSFSERLGSVRPFLSSPTARPDKVAFSNAANAFFRFFMAADGTAFQSPTGFIIADRNGFREGALADARFVYNDFAVEQAARAQGLAPDAFGKTFAAGRQFGDAGRNTLFGPRLSNMDFAMLKTTKLSEKVSLQFRAEFFNLFNHPSRPGLNYVVENAGGFGFADPGEADAAPRNVRVALKLIF